MTLKKYSWSFPSDTVIPFASSAIDIAVLAETDEQAQALAVNALQQSRYATFTERARCIDLIGKVLPTVTPLIAEFLYVTLTVTAGNKTP